MFSNFFFFENRAGYEIMWKNLVQPGRQQMSIWGMHAACWIPNAANTHPVYVIVLAFPLQQWLHKCASLLCHTYSAYLVMVCFLPNDYVF